MNFWQHWLWVSLIMFISKTIRFRLKISCQKYSRVRNSLDSATKASSLTYISATERLSITKYCWSKDHTNTFTMSPITWNSIQDHRRSRPLNFCLLSKSLHHCPMNFWPYCTYLKMKKRLSKVSPSGLQNTRQLTRGWTFFSNIFLVI